MTQIGRINQLRVLRETANGLYLDGGELGEILMPQKFVSEQIRSAGEAAVFVYTDSEDRLVATPKNRWQKWGSLHVYRLIRLPVLVPFSIGDCPKTCWCRLANNW